MKTQLPSAIILCALLLVLSLHAFAAGNQTTHVSSSGTSHGASNASALLANALGTRYTGYTITIQPTAAGEAAPTAALLSDASSRTCSAGTTVVEGETYLAAAPVLRALYPGLAVTEQADTLSAQGDDLHLEALAGEAYFTVNDRCFYVPCFVQAVEGQVYLPLDTFAEALGCTPSTDPTTGDLRLSQTGAPATAPIYPEEDLYWLSRAIYSESGNQPHGGPHRRRDRHPQPGGRPRLPRHDQGRGLCSPPVLPGGQRDHLPRPGRAQRRGGQALPRRRAGSRALPLF